VVHGLERHARAKTTSVIGGIGARFVVYNGERPRATRKLLFGRRRGSVLGVFEDEPSAIDADRGGGVRWGVEGHCYRATGCAAGRRN
jgi:hypothetical protein